MKQFACALSEHIRIAGSSVGNDLRHVALQQMAGLSVLLKKLQ